MKTNSEESLRVLLRLLIDEIVEDLSRSGIQEQVSSKTKRQHGCGRRIGLSSPESILQGQPWSPGIL